MNKKILIVTALTGFVRAFLLDDIKILQDMGYQVECAANGLNDSKTLEENYQFFKEINVKFYHAIFSILHHRNISTAQGNCPQYQSYTYHAQQVLLLKKQFPNFSSTEPLGF